MSGNRPSEAERLRVLADAIDALASSAGQALTDSELDRQVQSAFDQAEPAVTAQPPKDNKLPAAFGNYRCERVLGRGGMGTVFEVTNTLTGGRCALKTIQSGGSETLTERFRREIQTAAQLDVPGICKVFHAGEEDGVLYYTMELVEGEVLSSRLGRERGAFSQPPSANAEAARQRAQMELFERLARTVHSAHEAGVVHRDLKPSNIMVRLDGQPVLLDFGLAVRIGEEMQRLTHTGTTTGTPAYMASEQIERRTIDRRTDVYALGVMLFEALTLQLPYATDSREALFRQIVDGAAPDPRSLNSLVDCGLGAICLKAMRRLPRQRYETAGALADDLRRWLDGKMPRARPLSQRDALLRWVRCHRVVIVLLLAVALAIAGTSAVATNNRSAARARAQSVLAASGRVIDAKVSGREPDPRDERVMLTVFSTNEVGRFSADILAGKAHKVMETIGLVVTERIRGQNPSSPLLAPHRNVVDPRPEFVFRVPDERYASWNVAVEVRQQRGDDNVVVAEITVPASQLIAGSVVRVCLPAGQVLDVQELGDRPYSWTIRPQDQQHPDRVRRTGPEWPAAEFHVLRPAVRDAACGIAGGKDTLLRLHRALALILADFAHDAVQELEALTLPPEHHRLRAQLLAAAFARLDDGASAQQQLGAVQQLTPTDAR